MSKIVGLCLICKVSASLQCSSCHAAPYCGKQHQKDDWPKHKYVCRSYEVKTTPGGDFCVVAARDIKKGDVIIDETPLVVGPSYLTDKQTVCPGCHQDHVKQHCPSCNWPVCSIKCSGLKDVTRHGAECAVLSKVKSSVIIHSSDIILPLRCLLLQKTDPKKWKVIQKMAAQAANIPTNTSSKEVRYLMQESILKPLTKSAPELLPDCSEETVHKVFTILDVYGVDIEAPQYSPMYAICSVASFMEHSCLPNTRRLVNVPPANLSRPDQTPLRCRVVVRAAENIPTGEKITTLFMDTWMSTWARQLSLASRRQFHCRCRRCLDPTELGTHFGTLRCTNERCDGWVLAENLLLIDFSNWKCQKCGKTYPFMDIFKLLMSLKNDIDGCRAGSVQNIQKYEKLLKRLEKFLHPRHHFCLLVKERLYSKLLKQLVTSGGRDLSDAELERAAELCCEVLSVMISPAIVEQKPKTHECLLFLSHITEEMAKRKKASGEWDSARAERALENSRKMVAEAVRLRGALIDPSGAEERLPIEQIQKMFVSVWSATSADDKYRLFE